MIIVKWTKEKESMGEPSKDSTRCPQNSPSCQEFNCSGTQPSYMGRQYLISQSNDTDILGARLLYADNSKSK